MAKRVVVVMALLAVASALVSSRPDAVSAPKNKCTHVLAPGESC